MKSEILQDIKIFVTTLFTAVSSVLGNLAIPMYLLAGLNITDYVTGILAAPYRGEKRNSQKGFRGIMKKICMWILVGVGWAMDYMISFSAEFIGITLPCRFTLAAAVCIWIICNELISILENIGDIGTPLPSFLMKAVQWLKKSTEENNDIEEE